MSGLADFGLMVEPQFGMSMDQLVSVAREAERLGFGYFFRSDHLLPTDDSRGKESPECWTSLGAVAASTKTIRFGPMVTPIGFRNPALLARMACTLHSFSGGRLQLAVGAGWYEPEYKAHGYEFPSFRVRREQFQEALLLMLALVRQGRAEFRGKYFSAATDCLPRPSGNLNVIVGTTADSLVKLAGRHADEWNFFAMPPGAYREKRAVLEAAAGGRKVAVSQMCPFIIGETRAEMLANAKAQLDKFGRQGPPEAVLERLKKAGAPSGAPGEFAQQVGSLVDAGVQRIYFQVLVPENRRMTELLAATLKNL